MQNRIVMDTRVLDLISRQFSRVSGRLDDLQADISSAQAQVRRVASEMEGIIGAVRRSGSRTGAAASRARGLAAAVQSASALMAQTERSLAYQSLAEGSSPFAGAAAAAAAAGQAAAVAQGVIGQTIPVSIGTLPGLAEAGYTTLFYRSDDGNSGSTVHTETVSQNGNVTTTVTEDFFGYNKESKLKTDFDPGEGDLGLIEAETSADVYAYKGEVAVESAFGETKANVTVGDVGASGKIGVTLMKDGVVDPRIYAGAEVGAYVAKAEVSHTIGDSNLGAEGSVEGTLLGAEASAKAELSKDGVDLSVGADAYVAKAEASGSFNFLGIKIKASGEAMAGVNATAGVNLNSGAVSGKIGFGPFRFSLSIDWSGWFG